MRLELRLGSETAATEVVEHRLDRLDWLGVVESVEPSAKQPTFLAADPAYVRRRLASDHGVWCCESGRVRYCP
jgi:hypothetical protein